MYRHYDYIIAGMGAAGLSLAYRLIRPEFDNKRILLLDQTPKTKNDRTWSFWEKDQGAFEEIVFKHWSSLYFRGTNFELTFDTSPYKYKMIRGIDFYNFVLPVLKRQANIDVLYAEIENIQNDDNQGEIKTKEGVFTANFVFNSALLPNISTNKYNYLLQHFKGWVIETKAASFNPDQATFMDFDTPQEGAARFFYVLPSSEKKALVELAVFSETLLASSAYDKLLKSYIREKLNIYDYCVTEEEFGVIPMTDYPFHQHQTQRLIHIGTAGGQVKPSTGYTFQRIQRHSERIIENLLRNKHPLFGIKKPAPHFQFYDRVLLNVIRNNRADPRKVFTQLFQRNDPVKLLKFLNEETSLLEDLNVILVAPKLPFLKAALDELL